MLPFPLDPSSFPDVQTRKALIAIDLQNDFLAKDGALRVKQPDGMVAKIVDLAKTFRDSGYGDVIWVRSQFETNRAAGEEQIMATDTPQMPARLSSRGRQRASASPLPSTPLEGDSEAFLSVVGGQAGSSKPQCVRKGTPGAELHPEIAAAKGSNDYAMTKTYYSAFQSGQLLQLLRTRFATELYICGAISNVSVYATALAASSYGFTITIVDDCCGYRSETRHMNAQQKLTELTGCEFLTAEEIIPALEPKSPKKETSNEGAMLALIAAARANGSRSRSSPMKAIPVRLKSEPEVKSLPSSSSSLSTSSQRKADKKKKKKKENHGTSIPNSSTPSKEDLKLSSTASAGPAFVSASPTANEVLPKPQDSPQPEAGQVLQPVASQDREINQQKPIASARANAQQQDRAVEPDNTHSSEVQLDAKETSSDSDSSKDGKSRCKTVGDAETSTAWSKAETGEVPSEKSNLKGATTSSVLSEETDSVSKSPLTADSLQLKIKRQTITKTPETLQPQIPEKSKTSKSVTMPQLKDISDGESESAKAEPNTKSMTLQDNAELVGSEPLCEGDTTVVQDLLPPSLEAGIFERLKEEVQWQRMSHQGGEVPRLVAVQGAVDEDGSQPVYRHPSDEAPPLLPFTPTVLEIKEHVEKQLGHALNHALIQLYRGGTDYISEHSDKTLDIIKGSFIANVSLGAERVMVFRTKRADKDPSKTETTSPSPKPATTPPKKSSHAEDALKRKVVRAPLSHNSLCRVGLKTNEKWLHSIRQDKRLDREKTAAELAYSGARISLTFRHIGTYLDRDSTVIWGQGATRKSKETAKPVINGQTNEAVTMLRAFSRENQTSDFDWAAHYGTGFDVLHVHAAQRFFGCSDGVIDARVRIMLAECGLNKFAKGNIGFSRTGTVGTRKDADQVVLVKFVDNDAGRTTVTGDVAIMLYLDATTKDRAEKAGTGAAAAASSSPQNLANVYTIFQSALALGDKWRAKWSATIANRLSATLRPDLAVFDAWAKEAAGKGRSGSIAALPGGAPSLADYALWPVLHDMAVASKEDGVDFRCFLKSHLQLPALDAYYATFASRDSVVHLLGDVLSSDDEAACKEIEQPAAVEAEKPVIEAEEEKADETGEGKEEE